MYTLSKLKAMREKITKGEWKFKRHTEGYVIISDETKLIKDEDGTADDFRFIAASPAILSQLIASMEEREKPVPMTSNGPMNKKTQRKIEQEFEDDMKKLGVEEEHARIKSIIKEMLEKVDADHRMYDIQNISVS